MLLAQVSSKSSSETISLSSSNVLILSWGDFGNFNEVYFVKPYILLNGWTSVFIAEFDLWVIIAFYFLNTSTLGEGLGIEISIGLITIDLIGYLLISLFWLSKFWLDSISESSKN